jgi:hypothetical protein
MAGSSNALLNPPDSPPRPQPRYAPGRNGRPVPLILGIGPQGPTIHSPSYIQLPHLEWEQQTNKQIKTHKLSVGAMGHRLHGRLMFHLCFVGHYPHASIDMIVRVIVSTLRFMFIIFENKKWKKAGCIKELTV